MLVGFKTLQVIPMYQPGVNNSHLSYMVLILFTYLWVGIPLEFVEIIALLFQLAVLVL